MAILSGPQYVNQIEKCDEIAKVAKLKLGIHSQIQTCLSSAVTNRRKLVEFELFPNNILIQLSSEVTVIWLYL